ncbi:MAG: hypothetical protein MOB07_05680 [Acidobacteria bacterium]|nr:hypothetical protein [Acidobacteriota bacterium]
MQNRSSKTKKREPKDVNELAFSIVEDLISDDQPTAEAPEKNPSAVALGRLGGLKGGKARAAKLSAAKRKAIAKKAAKARWGKSSKS